MSIYYRYIYFYRSRFLLIALNNVLFKQSSMIKFYASVAVKNKKKIDGEF